MLAAVRAAIYARHLFAYAAIYALHVFANACAIYALHLFAYAIIYAVHLLADTAAVRADDCLYICPHTTIYVLVLLHVSSYYHICVLILLNICPHTNSYYCICVLVLLWRSSLASTTGCQWGEGGSKTQGGGGGEGSSGGGKGGVVLDLLSVVCARGYSECAVALVETLSEGAGTHSLLALLVQKYKC